MLNCKVGKFAKALFCFNRPQSLARIRSFHFLYRRNLSLWRSRLLPSLAAPTSANPLFFNRIAGKRISIVEDTPGVTRDRIYADVEWQNRRFTLIDTGGIDPHSDDVLLSQMRRQAEIAMDTADVICFFADGRDGLTDDDREVANLLRKTKKPILLVVNKVDHISMNDNIYEFYELGLGDPIAISAANMLGLGDLLQAICEKAAPCRQGRDGRDRTYPPAGGCRPPERWQVVAGESAGRQRTHDGIRHCRHDARRD